MTGLVMDRSREPHFKRLPRQQSQRVQRTPRSVPAFDPYTKRCRDNRCEGAVVFARAPPVDMYYPIAVIERFEDS